MSRYFREEYTSLIDREEDLLNYINKFLTPSVREKKQKGEVFTPLSLIKEMLDKLPKEVWYNPNLKWLDPANGMGNFPIIIYLKLMKTLVKDFPDKEERKKHILENMIYVAELSIKNCFMFRNVLDPNRKYNLNIFCGNTLSKEFDENMKNEWKVNKFDIVVGNPPYQSNQNATGKRGGGDLLWNKFVFKSLNNLIKNKGYLVFVHPAGWRKPPSKRSKFNGLYDIMTKENHMVYLEIHNTKDGNKTFDCGTRYDFYIINKNNSNTNTNTNIIDELGNNISLNIKKFDWLPNYNFEKFIKIIDKENKDKIICDVSIYETRKTYVNSKKNDKFIYPLVHTTTKSGNRFFYSSKNDKGHFGISKIIFGDSGINDVIIDMEGKYGMTQHSMAIPTNDKNKAIKLRNALLSTEFQKFLKSCSWSNFQIDWRMFKYFKEDFWKYFINENDNSEELSINVDEEKTDKNETTNSNSLYTEKELKKKKLSELQEIAKSLNIPIQIPKTGKKKGMKNKSKADLTNDILNCD